MSHLFRTGTSVFKVSDNIFKVNDNLNVITTSKGGFGAIEILRCDPIIANNRFAITSGSTVKIIALDSLNIIRTISLSSSVTGVAWDNINNRLFAIAGGALVSINTTTWIITNTGLSGGLNALVVDPNPSNNRLLITKSTSLNFVDSSSFTIISTMSSGFDGAYGLAFDPENDNRVYIGNYGSDYITIVDTDNYIITQSMPGFNRPIDLSFIPNVTNQFLVSEYAGNSVAYVNKGTGGIVKRLSGFSSPEGISCDPNSINNRFFLGSTNTGIYYIVTEVLT